MPFDAQDFLTAQDIFDTSARHLLTQGRRAMRNGNCVMHGDGGVKCAIGVHLTPDEARDAFGLRIPERLEPHRRLLFLLNDVHDVFDPALWPDELAALACRERLTMVTA